MKAQAAGLTATLSYRNDGNVAAVETGSRAAYTGRDIKQRRRYPWAATGGDRESPPVAGPPDGGPAGGWRHPLAFRGERPWYNGENIAVV